MPTKSERKTAADALREAEEVRDELGTALRGAGIVLPSLSVDALAYGAERPDPLVELGRCNLATARPSPPPDRAITRGTTLRATPSALRPPDRP